jgi:SIT family siderophore-iron:H+ symporter-like MFS transporter
MFIILTPVLAMPITLTLWRYSRLDQVARTEVRAEKVARADVPLKTRLWAGTKSIFWQLDFVGLFLFTIGFGLFFTTITLANSRTSRWSDAHSIAQMVVGAILIIAFVLWERFYAPYPLLPFALLRRKTVIGCCLIALLSPMSGRIVAGYLFTFLQVAAGQSDKSATRITSFPSVAGTVTGIMAGIVARYLRVLKPIIIAGFCIQILGTGLMLMYRTSTNTQAQLAIVQLVR